MLRLADERMFDLVAQAVPIGTPVLWAPYDGPGDRFPRVAMQSLYGVETTPLGTTFEDTGALFVEVLDGSVYLELLGAVFELNEDSAFSAAIALSALITARFPDLTVTDGFESLTISSNAGELYRTAFSAGYGLQTSFTPDGEIEVVTRRRVRTVQVSVFSTNPVDWDPSEGAGALSQSICDNIDDSSEELHPIKIRSVRAAASYSTPSDRGGFVYIASVEYEQAWQETKVKGTPWQTGRVECVEVSINGGPTFEVEK